MSSVDISSEVIICSPIERVSGFAADPDNATKWYVNIKSVSWKTCRPLKTGSQIDFVARFLGKQLTYTYEIVEYIPFEKLVMHTINGPFPMETTYYWSRVSEAETRMILRNKGNPSGFSGFVAPLMSFAMKRANQKDLHRLKKLLEE